MISNCMLLPTTKLSWGLYWERKEEGALRRLNKFNSTILGGSLECELSEYDQSATKTVSVQTIISLVTKIACICCS